MGEKIAGGNGRKWVNMRNSGRSSRFHAHQEEEQFVQECHSFRFSVHCCSICHHDSAPAFEGGAVGEQLPQNHRETVDINLVIPDVLSIPQLSNCPAFNGDPHSKNRSGLP
ncbi:Uncharacterized protein Fot_24635 [Forsythia ovata]|uniref:Uncharacterized protein n=1 Tax=Forsythia ovata TaxID=205694 RepID=A0ABD1U6W8_9LAMI